MKRYQIILIVVVALIFMLWIVGRITGALQFYKVPASSMEPTLNVGQIIFTTNLKSPERNDIVVFKMKVNEFYQADSLGKESTFCKRLIGIGGDTVEVKNGFAYINNRLADDTAKLKFDYSMYTRHINLLRAVLNLDIEKFRVQGQLIPANDSMSTVFLSGDQYEQAKNKLPLQRNISHLVSDNQDYPHNWTIDNFGPYIVPADHYFVMGDNRHNSRDSRFDGPIPVKDLKGVAIRKY